jgi:hypothetical protein
MTLLDEAPVPGAQPHVPPVTPPASAFPWATWRPVLAATALAGVLHLLWWRLLATPGGDIAAQDAWAAFAKAHPGSAYDLAWYGGMHPVSYSAISPYLMAVLGVRPTMVVVGTLSAGLLALLLVRVAPRQVPHPMLPALVGAVALTGTAVSGRVTFGLGILFGLAAVLAAFAWPADPEGRPARPPLRIAAVVVLAAVATAASAVAGLFLGLLAAALWLSGQHRLSYGIGLPPVVVVLASAWLFPLSGIQPMAWNSAILPTVAGLTVVLLLPREWRVLRLLGWVYLVAVQLAWLVPSPVGTNISRLGLIFTAVALLAALPAAWRTSLAARRTGTAVTVGLVAAALVTSGAWQVTVAAKDAINSAPPASLSLDLDPIVAQLEARDAELGRVEVVPTASHRESTALASYVNLARGWNRQADAARNRLFYRERPLTPAAYQRWLHRWAVHYVVLTSAAPDSAAVQEQALVAGGLTYLTKVWSDADWSLYEVRNPTPLAAKPAQVLDFDAAQVTLFTPGPGPVVVRIAYSDWLGLVDAAGKPLPAVAGDDPAQQSCLSGLASDEQLQHPRDNWLVLHAAHGGVYRIGAPYKVPRGSACPSS